MAVEATVFARTGEPVRLCYAVADSYPPQCGGGVLVEELDLDTVPGMEDFGGLRWSNPLVRVTGVWDGEVLRAEGPVTAVEPGPVGGDDWFAPPCDPPPGGWPGWPVPSTDGPVQEHLDQHPDTFGGLWVSQSAGVLVARFTEGVDEHRRVLDELTGGRACVVGARYSHAELLRVQDDVWADRQELGVWSASSNAVANVVEVGVKLADVDTVRAFEQRWGDRVRVSGWLEPVP